MRITIKDIARETGLSLATVSNYLNHRKIKESNRLLIENAIQKLDYKPNRTAQYLRSGQTMTIAVVVPDLGNYFWGNLVSTVTGYFKKYGYTVITCSYYHSCDQEKVLLDDLIAKWVDGIVLLPFNSSDRLYHIIQEASIPVVVVDQKLESRFEFPVDHVLSENYEGGYQLARYLIDKGHRNISVLDSILYSSSVHDRILGICDACQESGFQPYIFDNQSGFITEKDTILLAKKHFQNIKIAAPDTTAVIFTNYASAMGGLTEAGSQGYCLPGELSIVSFDDVPLFGSMYPPLTSIGQNLDVIGRTASEILLRRINGDFSDFPLEKTLKLEFHERQSVSAL